MPTFRVMVAYFPGGNVLHPDVCDWLAETLVKMREDPRIGKGNVRLWRKADTPIDMVRNQALLAAEQWGADYVLMVDNDVSPDLAGEEPFWETSWEFAMTHAGPCVIAAPYNGPPPFEMCYAFRMVNRESHHPNPDFQIEAFPRGEAARLRDIVPAAALPTGLMLIDMRAVKLLPHPRFYYEWRDDGPRCQRCHCQRPGPRAAKASTEDVTFSRDLFMAGVPLYANFKSYCGHWKAKLVGRPQEIPADAIPRAVQARARDLTTKAPAARGKPKAR